ncbi:AAA domain protein [Clostridium argentinense CDC 2741]|uniref:AAA domain protein n=1 Tax=Clostridium argentinense CDC 2741 TaxID=1418104 RepID=A0A0C1TYF1_9CLOT|nr:AAA family ATPase [Clostridium argentinense]ARC83401.1 nucleotide kinase [Clostridium argentinense]KIE45729.1 AAA domain protein [Clostridium argentinense CDC 2741]NFF39153.1 nucleotide kinase [Clostridium argentinense]NFP49565.1 nucleotide kinase [Clostridium argentinense]NFP72268.1 nucleotide kinase [Clostridium argentinense]
MNNIYFIGSTMGVGKITTCNAVKVKLNNSVFLHGDWCWDIHPFKVTEETKQMVIKSICFLLNSFIQCSEYKNIIFCWVMHEQSIIDDIVSRLNLEKCNVKFLTLTCNAQALKTHLIKDINAGIRTEDIISRSIERLPLYDKLNTYKVDISNMSPEEAADFIIENR